MRWKGERTRGNICRLLPLVDLTAFVYQRGSLLGAFLLNMGGCDWELNSPFPSPVVKVKGIPSVCPDETCSLVVFLVCGAFDSFSTRDRNIVVREGEVQFCHHLKLSCKIHSWFLIDIIHTCNKLPCHNAKPSNTSWKYRTSQPYDMYWELDDSSRLF